MEILPFDVPFLIFPPNDQKSCQIYTPCYANENPNDNANSNAYANDIKL